MGIQGLLPALSPVTKAIHVKDYANKRVAIDGYSWLHKGAYSCSQELVLGIPTKNYINYFIGRVKMLMSYKIIPVVVFDGGPLPNKKLKEQERLQHREEYKSKGKAYLLEGNKAQAQTCFQKAVDITPKMAFFLIKELRRLNVEYLVAPYEADAQLTYLSITGQVDAIITEDSDLVAYGATQIILKMDKSGYAQEIKTEDLGSCKKDGYDFIDFNQTMIRHMCILSGCDYLPSLPGMGLKTSFKLLKQHRDIETVFRYLKREKPNFTAEYEQQFYKADFTFKHQRVYDPVTKTLTTLLPLDKEYPDSTEIDFIGPLIQDSVAERIALGIIDPETGEEFDSTLPFPKNTFKPQPKKSLLSFSKEFKNTGVNYDKLRNSSNNGKNKILNDGKLVTKTGNLNDQFTFSSNKITQYISSGSSSGVSNGNSSGTTNTSSPIIEEEPNIDIDFDLDDEEDDHTPTKKMTENNEGVCESDNDYDDDDYQPRGSSTNGLLLSSSIDKNNHEKDAFVLDSDEEQEEEVRSPSFMFSNDNNDNNDNNNNIKNNNNNNKVKKTLITSKFFSNSIVEDSDNEDDEDDQFQQQYQQYQQQQQQNYNDETQPNSLDGSIFRNEEFDSFKYQPKNQKNFRNVHNNNNNNYNNKSGVFTKDNNNNNTIKTTLLSSNDRVSLNFFDQFQFNGKKKQSILMSQSRKSLSSPSLSSNVEDYCSIGSGGGGSIPFNTNQMTNEEEDQQNDDNFKIVESNSSNQSNSQPLSISKNTFSNFLKRKSSSQTSSISNNSNVDNNNNNNSISISINSSIKANITTTNSTAATTEHSSYILKKSKYHSTPDSSQNLNDQSFISKKAHSFSSLNSDLVFEDNEDLDNFIFQDNDNENNHINSSNSINISANNNNNFKNNNIILTPKNNSCNSGNINNSNNIMLTSPPPPPSPYFNGSVGNSNNTTPARFIIPTTSTPIYNNKIFSTPPTTTTTPTSTSITTSINTPNILTNTPNTSTPVKQISPSSNDIISKYFSSPIKISLNNTTNNNNETTTPISLEGMSLRSRLSLRYQQTMALSSTTNENK